MLNTKEKDILKKAKSLFKAIHNEEPQYYTIDRDDWGELVLVLSVGFEPYRTRNMVLEIGNNSAFSSLKCTTYELA